jgi:hypothetical protein
MKMCGCNKEEAGMRKKEKIRHSRGLRHFLSVSGSVCGADQSGARVNLEADWFTGDDSQASILDTSGYLRVLHFLHAVEVSTRYRLHQINPIISVPRFGSCMLSIQLYSKQPTVNSAFSHRYPSTVDHVRLRKKAAYSG